MVDIVALTESCVKIYKVAYRSDYIRYCNRLRAKLSCSFKTSLFESIYVREIQIENFLENLVVNLFLYFYFFRIKRQIFCGVNKAVAEHLFFCSVFRYYPYIVYTRVLDLHSLFRRKNRSCGSDKLARHGRINVVTQLSALDSVCNSELIVHLEASDSCKIVSLVIKEGLMDELACGLLCRNIARAQTLVNFLKRVPFILGNVLFERCREHFAVSEKLSYLVVRREAYCSEKYRCGKLSRAGNSYIHNVFGVCLVFNPFSAHRDNGSLKYGHAVLVPLFFVISAR